MNSAQSQAKKFIRKYRIKKVKLSSKRLIEILESMGFSVIRYSHSNNVASINNLIVNIHREKLVRSVESFYYTGGTSKLVFVLEGLPEDDLIGLLVHEIGHIYCDETIVRTIDENTDYQREKTANDFKAYVLEHKTGHKIVSVLIIATVLVITLLAYGGHKYDGSRYDEAVTPTSEPTAISETATPSPDEKNVGNVYIAKTGTVYHVNRDCTHIKDKQNVSEISIETAETMGYALCKRCR